MPACLTELPRIAVEGETGISLVSKEKEKSILTQREWRQLDTMDFGPLPICMLDVEKLRRKGYDESEIAGFLELFEAARNFIHHNDGITTAEMDVFLAETVPNLGAREYDALFELGILEGIKSDSYLGSVITIAVHIESIYLKRG